MLSAEEAMAHHGPAGDNCWVGQSCHNRRSYYRNRKQRQEGMRSHYLTKKQESSQKATAPAESNSRGSSEVQLPATIITIPTPKTIRVPVPQTPSTTLHTYSERLTTGTVSEVALHAVGAELWVGDYRFLEVEPVHTFGWVPSDVKKYLRQVLETLQSAYEAEYNRTNKQAFTRFAQQIQHHSHKCPIRPCPLHPTEHELSE